MITCDFCGEAKDCLQKEIEGKEYDICSESWNPFAQNLRGKGLLSRALVCSIEVSGPVGVKRMTIASPNHANAASASPDSNGRRMSRRVSIVVRTCSLNGLLIWPLPCAPDLRRLSW